MSNRANRRIRKEIRTQLKHSFGSIEEQLQVIMKPKPHWMPKRVYTWLARMVVNVDYVEGQTDGS